MAGAIVCHLLRSLPTRGPCPFPLRTHSHIYTPGRPCPGPFPAGPLSPARMVRPRGLFELEELRKEVPSPRVAQRRENAPCAQAAVILLTLKTR